MVKKPEQTRSRPVLVTSKEFNDKYFPTTSERLKFSGMNLKQFSEKESVRTANADLKSFGGITIYKKIKLIEATQPPHTDNDLQMFEGGARKNWAVKASLAVRQHFTFGYGSELVIDLDESEKVGLTKEQISEKVKELTTIHKDIIKKAYIRDNNLRLVEKLITFWWQAVVFGRGLIIKFYGNEKQQLALENNEVKSLKTINSRRLGTPIFDVNNAMSFEGVVVDGQGLDKSSMIYGMYEPNEISPHTEGYGYSQLESIVDIAEELNIAVEEDFKEILKSAWLASIMFVINTAGLTEEKAKTKIQTIIDAIAPAKYIGINEDIQQFEQLDLDPDFDGLVKLVDNLETKIYKALHVPQFLVQSESIANRATALQSASLFINGIITQDQQWITNILSDQWYDPFVEAELKKKKGLVTEIKRKNQTMDFQKVESLQKGDILQRKEEPKETKFQIKRIFNQARVADFIDLADALSKLFGSGIWDLQKVNEELGSEDVTPRATKELEKKRQFAMEQARNNPKDGESNFNQEIKTAMASVDPKDLPRFKTALYQLLFTKLKKPNE